MFILRASPEWSLFSLRSWCSELVFFSFASSGYLLVDCSGTISFPYSLVLLIKILLADSFDGVLSLCLLFLVLAGSVVTLGAHFTLGGDFFLSSSF